MATKVCNLWWEFGTTKLFTLLEVVLKMSGCIIDISGIRSHQYDKCNRLLFVLKIGKKSRLWSIYRQYINIRYWTDLSPDVCILNASKKAPNHLSSSGEIMNSI